MRYTVRMAMQATELRKKLFQVLEEVSQGATVDITYKGASLKIVPAERSSRLGRLVERDLGLEIGPRDTGWSAEGIAEWEAEMNQFFGEPKAKR
jgi:prevent-host-death family protein